MSKEKNEKRVRKATGLISEFKTFIARGNVIDLAVGIIIGTAFTAIVNSVVNDIIMPLVGIIIGGFDFSSLALTVGTGDNAAVLTYGAFIQAVINFLIIAMCVFLIVKVINTVTEKAVKKEEEKPAEPPKPSDEVLLLIEIRDLLKKQNESK